MSENNFYDSFNQYMKKDEKKEEVEFLLSEEEERFTVFPIQHQDIWDMYKAQQACHWIAEEVDVSEDYSDWLKLSENEQHFIKNVLAFFAGSDGIVNLNLLERFTNDVKVMEAKIAYTYQAMMENVHGEMYSILVDTYIKDTEEREMVFNAIKHIPCIKKKAEWAFKWIRSKESFATRLIAFAIVEGIFFSGSFCAIFWLKKYKNLMPGLTLSNEFIARDEGLHCMFACLLYSKLVNKLDQKTVHKIIKEAVAIEKEFIIDSLPCALLGMNSLSMSQYIEFVADKLTELLGYKKIYGQTNPFLFMETIGICGKTNFFEKRPTQYRKAQIGNKSASSISTDNFTFSNDF